MALLTLPLVLAVVLVELAVGGAFVLWYIDRKGEAPSGFLKLTAGVDAAAIIFAAILLPAIPRAALAERAQLDAGRIDAFALLLTVVAALVILQLIFTFLPWRAVRGIGGLVVLLTGFVLLAVAAAARPAPAIYESAFEYATDPRNILAMLALPLGALALGGVSGAMLLGHWYLVTPKLSPGPLQRASLVVVVAVVLQSVVVAATFARGELLNVTDTGLQVALAIRIGVGLLMTLAVVLAGWWTARMNTQSSTGLLYVGLGTAIAGEIAARVVMFLTGIAV